MEPIKSGAEKSSAGGGSVPKIPPAPSVTATRSWASAPIGIPMVATISVAVAARFHRTILAISDPIGITMRCGIETADIGATEPAFACREDDSTVQCSQWKCRGIDVRSHLSPLSDRHASTNTGTDPHRGCDGDAEEAEHVERTVTDGLVPSVLHR